MSDRRTEIMLVGPVIAFIVDSRVAGRVLRDRSAGTRHERVLSTAKSAGQRRCSGRIGQEDEQSADLVVVVEDDAGFHRPVFEDQWHVRDPVWAFAGD